MPPPPSEPPGGAAPLSGRLPRAIAIGLVLLALLALIVPAIIVSLVHPVPHPLRPRAVARPVIAQTQLPKVDPLKFQALAPADAVSFNATIPFSTAANPAARPFHLAGDDSAVARATDCMAASVLYEAGDDSVGERAVAQVVINRVRHPAFPKTICGVVFEGSDRRTGCQFTFTCDGALANHRFSDVAWARARDVARRALTGSVFAPVGYATHYHTNWVVPYWSASLDKITAVGSHLFFRWTGWWGTPPAFNRRIDANEPLIAALALLSPAHQSPLDIAVPGTSPANDIRSVRGAAMLASLGTKAIEPVAGNQNSFIYIIPKNTPKNALVLIAILNCGERPYCKFLAWSSQAKAPHTLPADDQQIAAMSFSYFRDRSRLFEKWLWNCRDYQPEDPSECMKTQALLPEVKALDAPVPGVRPAPGINRIDSQNSRDAPEKTKPESRAKPQPIAPPGPPPPPLAPVPVKSAATPPALR